VRTSSDLVEAVVPTVAASQGAIIALSSAGPMGGWFYNAWTHPAADTIWERHQATADDCPRIPDSVVQEARLLRGPRYADREFYCKWASDDDAFLPPDMVDSIFAREVA
jgi:hypothetical protein